MALVVRQAVPPLCGYLWYSTEPLSTALVLGSVAPFPVYAFIL